jgi:hypothetical protein
MKKKIIVTPCIVISSLNVAGPTTPLSGFASCVRISSASTPPAPKNASVVKKYRSPIFL